MRFTCRNGETNEHKVTTPDSAKSLATSATRRMFSSRSSSVNPKSEFRPNLILSPSRLNAGTPLVTKWSSRWNERVDLPAPDRPYCIMWLYEVNQSINQLQQRNWSINELPVNQRVQPRNRPWPIAWPRTVRSTNGRWYVTFVALDSDYKNTNDLN